MGLNRSETAPASLVVPASGWQDVRCSCGRLLLRITSRDALKRGAKLEAKCPRCGARSYLVGGVEADG